ncbi:MAG: 3-phosphoshikimate 1-carboxyvinyltransferase [bacterium]
MLADTQQSPFLKKMLAQMPQDVRASFSSDQLNHLTRALGDSRHVIHPVDLRWTFNFWRFNYYFVFLAGRDRRALTRKQESFFRMTEVTALLGFLGFSTLMGILVLYLIKSAMGIDIFPNFSFGVWDWFQARYL